MDQPRRTEGERAARPPTADLGDAEYRELAAFRQNLRRYLHWAEERAAEAGVTPAQHQLMLAIRARGRDAGPTVGALATELMLRHHSVVGLVDRAAAAGLVERRGDPDDQRLVRVVLTEEGAERLRQLASQHVVELGRLGLPVHILSEGLGAEPLPER